MHCKLAKPIIWSKLFFIFRTVEVPVSIQLHYNKGQVSRQQLVRFFKSDKVAGNLGNGLLMKMEENKKIKY